MTDPLVSIIIPTFNRAHLIGETLDSVLAQTYQNWECIVVDDGSTDHTAEVLSSYCDKDSRFQYHHRPADRLPGGNAARNYGFEISKGEYLIFLDSDDIIIDTNLEYRVKYCNIYDLDVLINPTGTFNNVLGDSDLLWNKVEENSSVIEFVTSYLHLDMPWHTNGPTWNRLFYEKVGGWNESLGAWQDWELHCRLLFYNPEIFINVNSVDNYFRVSQHDSIGKAYKSKTYLLSILKAILSINRLLEQDKHIYLSVRKSYCKLIFKMLINFPLDNGHLWFPLKLLYKGAFFKGVSRISFFKFYITDLLMKSYKMKNIVLKKTHEKHQLKMDLKSSYLKHKQSSLDTENVIYNVN
ncbi:glycosyltransferase family 2 protein [Winogradskyella wichelsiae]|uniref:glycosyltransferase family 2 protein n=1 Tax=Winogradskyella wichelsiae TaxID=2697007 RepID=UPI003EF1D2CD